MSSYKKKNIKRRPRKREILYVLNSIKFDKKLTFYKKNFMEFIYILKWKSNHQVG